MDIYDYINAKLDDLYNVGSCNGTVQIIRVQVQKQSPT
jgi:hypothetical protein